MAHVCAPIRHFGQECHRSDVSSVHHIKRHMLSISPVAGDVNFGQLVKRVSARFLQCTDYFTSCS